MKTSISAIVIVKNEEKFIEDCLKSLDWCSEVIVVDTGSTDKTVAIAKRFGARVVTSNGEGYSDWRNKGLKEAKEDWILYIDADERVTPELRSEVTTLINKGGENFTAYAIPRKNIILGQEFRHGGQWPDYVKRLYKKSLLTGWSGNLHEEPEFKGNMGHLESSLIHNKHETFTEMVEKTNRWSEIEAILMLEAHHPPMNVPRFLTAMFREFWKRMIVQMAFLDGPKGIMYAIYQVFSKFVSYAKLWEMQMKRGEVK